MESKIKITQSEMDQWINKFNRGGLLMLTISRPHSKLRSYAIRGENLEPIIDEIIRLVNACVFGKNRRFEVLDGLVIEEKQYLYPHYHIIFSKPADMVFNIFKKRMCSIANLMCNENFIFDLSRSNFSQKTKDRLSKPCFDKFAMVTDYHENLANYLTKELQHANYYILQSRGFNRERDKLALNVIKYGYVAINCRIESER